jgi:hypothetical protein
MNYVLAGARRAAGSASGSDMRSNRSCPRRGIADMMTACESCRWTFQVSLTLCRLYSEGVIETYTDLTRGRPGDRIPRVGALSLTRAAA